MLAVYGIISIASGTCVACGGTQSRYEKQSEMLGGLLLASGLLMIGMVMPFVH